MWGSDVAGCGGDQPGGEASTKHLPAPRSSFPRGSVLTLRDGDRWWWSIKLLFIAASPFSPLAPTRTPEEGVFLGLTGCFCRRMVFGVGHLHIVVSQCVVTPLLSNLYPDLSHPLWIIAKTTSHKRKLWERISGCLLKNSKNVEMLSRTSLPTSLARHNPSSLEVLTNNLAQH